MKRKRGLGDVRRGGHAPRRSRPGQPRRHSPCAASLHSSRSGGAARRRERSRSGARLHCAVARAVQLAAHQPRQPACSTFAATASVHARHELREHGEAALRPLATLAPGVGHDGGGAHAKPCTRARGFVLGVHAESRTREQRRRWPDSFTKPDGPVIQGSLWALTVRGRTPEAVHVVDHCREWGVLVEPERRPEERSLWESKIELGEKVLSTESDQPSGPARHEHPARA